ncbi:MAG: thiamine pyrophosphate-binding protein [Candidatus Jordarchaeum sp.]|uniref:thiamine pyrophosphate-binding protein n=1 Tax=Candidatus Jordarchaeum sp. TaxID=2823881 RepID=UPI00404AA5EC
MVTAKGNRAIVDALIQNGVEYIFGICGTSVAGFLSALGTEESIKYVITRHERGAGSMADGYARASGKAGVCQMHSGPGTLNGVLSIVDAYRDSSPVVLLAGQVARRYIGRDIFGEANQFAVLEPYTKHRERIGRVQDVPRIINNAFYLAQAGRPGPVMVEMPEDIYDEEGEVETEYMIKVDSQSVSPSMVEEATERLIKAEKPVILAGGGVIRSNASEELKTISEMLQIPVTTTQNGRGCFPEDHPLALGVSGWCGGISIADDALEEADVVLGVGCTISSLTTYNFTTPIKGDIIQINIDPSALGVNYHCDYGIVGDAKTVLLEMIRILDSKGARSKLTSVVEELKKKKTEWNAIWGADVNSDSVPIKPQRLLRDVQKAIPKKSIVVAGAGLHRLFITAFMQTYYPRTFLGSVNLGSMGFAFPAAIGAKAAKPEEPVVCVVGDGDFMMTLQDLETAVRCGFNVVTVIMNNNSYAAPKMFQKVNFGTDFGSDYTNPDFAKVAENFGACGWRVEKPDEIVDTVKSALDCGKPAVIDVLIDPDAFPPLNLKASGRLRNIDAEKVVSELR